MLDSGTKHPENRIHLYDPVGLITDSYGGFRPSSYAVRPRRQTVSYDNFVETSGNGLRSYDSLNDVHSTGVLQSYDSFEVDSMGLRSCGESFELEANGGRISSYDSSTTVTATTARTTATTAPDQDRNDGGLRFVVVNKGVEDDQSDDSTPRLWKPKSPTNPKHARSPLHHSTTPDSTNSSFHPTSPNPSVVNSTPSLKPTSPKSVNFSPLNPTPVKSVVTSTPLNPTSVNQQNYQAMSPSSRTQAIAKGRKELMDMVRDLPETFYELSLRDIVEQKPVFEMQKEKEKEINVSETKMPMKETANPKETKKEKKSSTKKVKKSESKKKMVRSRSVDNGKFLLKTSVFPILGSRKTKKSLTAASSFKVAPMPKSESTSAVKVGEKDWWRRKSCISSESDHNNDLSSHSSSSSSSRSSSRSNSSIGRRGNKFLPSCCLFNGRRMGGNK